MAAEPELVANFLYMLAMLRTGVAVAMIMLQRRMKRLEVIASLNSMPVASVALPPVSTSASFFLTKSEPVSDMHA